jgi:hypothetical protein
VKNLRKNRRGFGFAAGGGSGGVAAGGAVGGLGGRRGTLSAGIVVEVGVAGVGGVGVAVLAVTTGPCGNGSDVAGLADPGSTGGVGS